jgi:hypothetical protein
VRLIAILIDQGRNIAQQRFFIFLPGHEPVPQRQPVSFIRAAVILP